jgi:3-methylfumaryl-CoA hydratase
MAEDRGETNLTDWIGRSETVTDMLAPTPVAALNATLDRDDPVPAIGDALPPLYHWLYFLELAPTAALDSDGHPKRGGFLPPVTLPRRMWVGSDVTFTGALKLGEAAMRTSTIDDIVEKDGRSGRLIFVSIRHEIAGAQGIVITDRQTVVYRDKPDGVEPPPRGKPAPGDAQFSRTIEPSAALLFRYSALIFNAHRIHYDQPYTTEVEGYPGLLVHGPLLATLLTDLARRQDSQRAIRRFRFSAVKPVFDDAPFQVCGRADGANGMVLWVRDGAGDLCVDGAVELA